MVYVYVYVYVYAYAYVYAYVYVCVWDPNKGPNLESSLSPPGGKNQPLYPRPNTPKRHLTLIPYGHNKEGRGWIP